MTREEILFDIYAMGILTLIGEIALVLYRPFERGMYALIDWSQGGRT